MLNLVVQAQFRFQHPFRPNKQSRNPEGWTLKQVQGDDTG